MQERELAPFATNDDDDGVDKIKDLGQVEDPENSSHASLLRVEWVADQPVALLTCLKKSSNNHVSCKKMSIDKTSRL